MGLKRWAKHNVGALILSLILVVVFAMTLWMRDRYVVPILTYHHIGDFDHPSLILNSVSEDNFDKQMKFLADHDYHVISTNALVEGINNGKVFARNTVVVQFDDGYTDNFTKALPILRKYDIPATVFIVSDKMGTPGFMTWEQVHDMEQYKITIGSHTRMHKYIPSLSSQEMVDEIGGSKRVIEQKLGHAVDYFCFPSGGFTDDAKKIAKQEGYLAAFTTNRGRDRLNHDLYEIKRIRVKNTDGSIALFVKLSGYYNLFRKSKEGD